MISTSFNSLAALGVLALGLAPALGAERVLWQIGKSDKSYDDLAMADSKNRACDSVLYSVLTRILIGVWLSTNSSLYY